MGKVASKQKKKKTIDDGPSSRIEASSVTPSVDPLASESSAGEALPSGADRLANPTKAEDVAVLSDLSGNVVDEAVTLNATRAAPPGGKTAGRIGEPVEILGRDDASSSAADDETEQLVTTSGRTSNLNPRSPSGTMKMSTALREKSFRRSLPRTRA